MQREETDVIICGGGPTGMLLSAYLGRAGIDNIVLERELDITDDPRGIALDEEGIRYMQGLGLYGKLFTEIGIPLDKMLFIGGTQQTLHATPFMMIDNSNNSGTGHPLMMLHKQPAIERNLRDTAASNGHSELRSGSTMTDIWEASDRVFVKYTDRNGVMHEMCSKFLVGADGKTGFTRKKYLEAKGVRLEQATAMGYEEVWVALNWHITPPTRESHPDFPLWKLDYSSEDVYDLFFPAQFRFLCNPDRPAVCGRFGRPEDRLWRFEFVVQKNEDGQSMSTPESIRAVVFPYITHPGSKYGLDDDVQFPKDCIEVLRCRPFKFSARSCNKWAKGRVMLVGDAAHVFPPFGGQGIASGFRDAISLYWRLALICKPDYAGDYSDLITSWYLERKQQLEHSLRSTVHNGALCTERNNFKIFVRDWTLWLLQLVPSMRRKLELGPRAEGLPTYQHLPGTCMPFLPKLKGGLTLPQVYCRRLQGSADMEKSRVVFTDDIIYNPIKTGCLQMVVLLHNVQDLDRTRVPLKDIETRSAGFIREEEATYIVHDLEASIGYQDSSLPDNSLVRIASGDEFAADPIICRNRPSPKQYDVMAIMTGMGGATYVIVRPDRFVFAGCHNEAELDEALRSIPESLA